MAKTKKPFTMFLVDDDYHEHHYHNIEDCERDDDDIFEDGDEVIELKEVKRYRVSKYEVKLNEIKK